MLENIFRMILLAEIAFSFVFAVLILFYYAQRQRRDRRMRSHLTAHVISMLITFGLLCVSSFLEILSRFNQPLSWRTPLLLAAFTIAVGGELFMLNHQMQKTYVVNWKKK